MMPYRQSRLFALMVATLVAAGCASTSGGSNEASPSIFETAGETGRSIAAATGRFVQWGDYAAMTSIFFDPAAPNWEVEEAWFPRQHYYLYLKMRRGSVGGAGEARQVFKQRAEEIMRRNSYKEYAVIEYSEGLESSVLGSQRVAKGVIHLRQPEG